MYTVILENGINSQYTFVSIREMIKII